MNCFYGPVSDAGARRATPAAAFQSVAVVPALSAWPLTGG